MNETGYGFNFSIFDPRLESYIDKNSFSKTIRRANKICEEAWKIKRQEEVLPNN